MDDFGSKEDANFLYVKGEKKLFNSTISTWLKMLHLWFENFFNRVLFGYRHNCSLCFSFIVFDPGLVSGFLVFLSFYGSTIKGYDKEKFKTKRGFGE